MTDRATLLEQRLEQLERDFKEQRRQNAILEKVVNEQSDRANAILERIKVNAYAGSTDALINDAIACFS